MIAIGEAGAFTVVLSGPPTTGASPEPTSPVERRRAMRMPALTWQAVAERERSTSCTTGQDGIGIWDADDSTALVPGIHADERCR